MSLPAVRTLRPSYLSAGLRSKIPTANRFAIAQLRTYSATSRIMVATLSYDDALDCLNSLQTPFHILEQRRKAGMKPGPQHFQNTLNQLKQLGYTPDDLTPLNITHVAGTKGKGSVCAYVASILNTYRETRSLRTDRPLKVGLFTSPHLVSVRERIRIDGQPIPKHLFAKYFFEVWDKLALTKEQDAQVDCPERPPYFRFLTLMSFHTFLSEGVNAAVYEVGVGGEYDSTNVITYPVGVGISKLGIDHVATLGRTIEEISWHKAGILRTGSRGFISPQLPAAREVVRKRAEDKGVELVDVGVDPRLAGQCVRVMPDAEFQRENASLAIELAEVVVRKLAPTYRGLDSELPDEFKKGLEEVKWRGRCETLSDPENGKVKWYIDGAHTADSLRVAASWYNSVSQPTRRKVLVFNQQGRDEANDLLEVLFCAVHGGKKQVFNTVIFCANTTYKSVWKKDNTNLMQDKSAIERLTVQTAFANKWAELVGEEKAEIKVLASIEEAIESVRDLSRDSEVECLVTGSLHLVGGVLGVLEGDS